MIDKFGIGRNKKNNADHNNCWNLWHMRTIFVTWSGHASVCQTSYEYLNLTANSASKGLFWLLCPVSRVVEREVEDLV